MNPILKIEGLKKSFGGLQAVRDLSFSVNEGEVLGIIGPNGAGKTTVINLVSGVYRPDSGRVWFAGEDVTGLPPYVLARKGLVRTFQAAVSYKESSVWENVLRGAFLHIYPGWWHTVFNTARARRLREEATARARQLLLQLGMDSVVHAEAASLPYGYQKTLGVAVALACQPRIILLDEPAAGLSGEETNHILQVIRAVNKTGVTVVVVDHNVRFMKELCDRMVVVHYGELLAQGTPEEIIQDPKVVAAYLGSGYAGAQSQ